MLAGRNKQYEKKRITFVSRKRGKSDQNIIHETVGKSRCEEMSGDENEVRRCRNDKKKD